MKAIKKQVKKYLSQRKKGVIYCQTVEQVKTVAYELTKSLKRVDSSVILGTFYGDMSDVEKSNNLDDYRNVKCELMVCTNAFGMGVNIHDIEYIIHIGLPLSVENYYQEIGRGARGDGYECECTLHYCRTADNNVAKYLLECENDNSYRARLAYDRYDKLKAIIGNYSKDNILSDEVHEDIYEYFLNQDSLEVITSEAYESVNIRERMHLFVNNTYVANEIRKGHYNSYNETSDNGRHYFGKTQNWVKYNVYNSTNEELADRQLTYFDMVVADAVYTLWLNYAKITPKGIWILLTGDKDISLKRQKADVMRKSLDKISGYCISIEYHDDNVKRYGILHDEETYLHTSIHKSSAYSTSSTGTQLICGRFLPFDNELLKKNQYVLTSIPPLYEYAERRYDDICMKITDIMECFIHSGLIYGYEAAAKDKNEKLGGRKGRPTQLVVDVYSKSDKIRYSKLKKTEVHEE